MRRPVDHRPFSVSYEFKIPTDFLNLLITLIFTIKLVIKVEALAAAHYVA